MDGAPDYCLDFSRMEMNCWTGLHQDVPQFGRLKGHTYLEGPWLSLSCADFGEMYTGHHLWEDYSLSCTLRPVTGEVHLLQARVQGAMRSYAAGFYGSGKAALLKNQNGYQVAEEAQLPLGGWQGVPFNPLREGKHRHAGGGWEQASGVGGPPASGAWMRGCGRAAGQPLPV